MEKAVAGTQSSGRAALQRQAVQDVEEKIRNVPSPEGLEMCSCPASLQDTAFAGVMESSVAGGLRGTHSTDQH